MRPPSRAASPSAPRADAASRPSCWQAAARAPLGAPKSIRRPFRSSLLGCGPMERSTFEARRQRLMSEMGDRAVAIIAAAPTAIRNHDVEHEYRQESDFYYLTGLDEPNSLLVLSNVHGEHEVVLFVRPRDPERETWDGPRIGVDGAKADYGADAAVEWK